MLGANYCVAMLMLPLPMVLRLELLAGGRGDAQTQGKLSSLRCGQLGALVLNVFHHKQQYTFSLFVQGQQQLRSFLVDSATVAAGLLSV